MNDASANAHILYSVMFTPAASAAGSLSRIDAHARPGFVGDVDEREQEHERGDDDDVPVEGGVADRHRGPADGRVARRERVGDGRALESVAAVREVDDPQHDGHRTREHERDQCEVEAGEPQRREPDEDADRRR